MLIDGDLRRPTVAKKMGLPAGAGLSDVLAGRAEVTELLQRVPGVSNLLVLTAGTVPPNPSEILGSERMHTLMRYLATEATVIVDAPPLLPVTDGAVLAHQADGALLVVSAGKTTYDLAGKAFEALANARGRALGIVINRAPLRGVDASPYAYTYYTYYSENDKPGQAGTDGSRPAAVPAADAPVPFTDAPAAVRAVTVPAADRAAAGQPAAARSEAMEAMALVDQLRADQPPPPGTSDADALGAPDVFAPLLGDEEELTPRTRDRSRRS